MRSLEGKTAIVTGGGQGIGLGIALSLSEAGANVLISGRNESKLQMAAGHIREETGGNVLPIVADVSQRDSVDKTVNTCIEKFGQLDILVNNAQSAIVAIPVEDCDDGHISTTLGSGFLGCLYHMQTAFPHLKQSSGSVINISSREAILGGKGFGIYAATKAAIRALSKTTAREWGKYGIRVNVICPVALSPAGLEYVENHPEESEVYLSQISLGRFGEPLKDIGPVAVFLASEEAHYVTGQTICVDGGQVML